MATDNHNLPPNEEQDKIKDPYLVRALRHLEQPADQPWTKDNRFVMAGRWQMINYPNIMIAPTELAYVIQILEQSLPDRTYWKRVFELVESTLKTYAIAGKSIRTVNAQGWLIGWALDQTLEVSIKDQRLKNAVAVTTSNGTYRGSSSPHGRNKERIPEKMKRLVASATPKPMR